MQACVESVAVAPTQKIAVFQGFIRSQMRAGARALGLRWGWPEMTVAQAQLPVYTLAGLDPAHARALLARGVRTIGELRGIPKPVLKVAFGDPIGLELWERVRSQK